MPEDGARLMVATHYRTEGARTQAELAREMAREGGYVQIERRATEVLEGAVPTGA